jgi:ribonuclease R
MARAGQIVALLEKRGRFLVGTRFFPDRDAGSGAARRREQITVERDRRASEGDLVLLRTAGQGKGRAKVQRRLGRPDVARDVIEALMLDRGLSRSFADKVVAEAKEAAVAAPRRDVPRRDLRELPTFTIDPVTARDFDDAISAAELGDGHWRIHVHIADVSAHIRPGGQLEREAYRRATSVYVPGAVEPMLPEALSNRACSLVPGEDRLAVTAELELRGAEIAKATFYRSLIRSDERLDYDRVDRVFAGREPALDPWGGPLAAARAAAGALDRARAARGALVVASSEPEFAFDDAGHVTSVAPSEQTESHRVIEHLMIAANEAVARLLSDRGIPALYRVHERPEPIGVRRLLDQLASLDIATPPVKEHMSAQEAADIVGEASRLVDQHVRRTGRGRAALTSLVLRTLKQAHYHPANLGHAGLHSSAYCHFTSPIRRYPDLVCHRALLSAVGGGEDAPRADSLSESAVWTSAREREAMSVERDADDIAQCFLLERAMFERGHDAPWEGEIVGLAGVGAFVAFGDGDGGVSAEGLLPARRLKGEWWELNEESTILRGERSGRTLRLGDPVTVEVGRIDIPRGRVDLHPVGL